MTFNAEFTAIIQNLIAEQGKDAFINPAKCKAFLPDYTKNEYAKERHLLLKVVETGVAREIAAANLDICKKQQVRYLKEDLFMAEDAAADVVDLLAFVLRRDTGRTALEAPKPAPQKPEDAAAAEPRTRPAPKPAPQKPEETLYTIRLNFQQSGPFSLEQLENMISSRHVSNDYWIRLGDETDWMAITALPQLKPFFENVPQPAPSVGPMPAKNAPVKEARTQTTAGETQENKQKTTPGESKYKHSLVARIFLTLCLFVLAFCVFLIPLILTGSTFILILSLPIGIMLWAKGVGKVWEPIKRRTKGGGGKSRRGGAAHRRKGAER
jgi:hypothetical protein